VKEDELGVAAADVACLEEKIAAADAAAAAVDVVDRWLRWWDNDAVATTLVLEEEEDMDSSIET
jgi:uncharacterized protein involved in response to NO